MESRTDPRTGRDAHEMGSFETKPLPTSPMGVHRKESGGGGSGESYQTSWLVCQFFWMAWA